MKNLFNSTRFYFYYCGFAYFFSKRGRSFAVDMISGVIC